MRPKDCRTPQGSIRTPGLRIAGRVELGLGGAQGGGEGGRALAVVPGAVVAADRVVVGDRAAALDQRLGDRGLDLVPLLDLSAAHGRRQHREVGRDAVGIDVGEAAADPRRTGTLDRRSADLRHRLPRRRHHARVELLEAVPGDRRLEGLRKHPAGDERVAQVRRQQERPAPSLDRRRLTADGPIRDSVGFGPSAAFGVPPWARAISRATSIAASTGWWADSKPRISRLALPLPAPVSSASEASSRRQLAGCRPDWAISRTAPRGGQEVAELDPAGGLELGPGAHPHPGLGDRAEDALGADQHPVRRGPGARARQPPALPGPARGDRPHRLDQVVDVGLQGREVPAGPGRDPAAEGRVLEGLREVAQGEAVLAQLLFQPRPGGPGLDPRRQRLRVDLQHPVEPAQVHRHHRPLAQPRLDPADDAGAAAERDHRRALGLGPAQHRLDLRLVAREGDQVRWVGEVARRSPGRRRGRTSPARARPARSARRRTGPRAAPAPSAAPPAAPPAPAAPASRPRHRTRTAPGSLPPPPASASRSAPGPHTPSPSA